MSPKETAYIVERLAVRFMAMVAEYERKLLEHRDSFGARTSADARIIEGMRAELQEARRNACLPGESLNEAITRTDRELDTAREQRDSIQVERDALRAEVADLRGIVDMVHASLGIKQGDHIGNAIAALKLQSVTTPKRSHPVKDGEYVRRTKAACAHFGHVAKVLEFIEPCSYEVQCIEGRGIWVFHNCEPCDPPVDHDTPAGKEAAEASVMAEIKVGDVVRAKFWKPSMRAKVTEILPDGRLMLEASSEPWKVDEVVKMISKVPQEAAEAVIRDSQMTDTHDCGPNCPHCSW